MNIALIVAGGKGERMGSNIPKQFIEINGKPLIFYTINAFEKHPDVDKIAVVVHKDYVDYVLQMIVKFDFNKLFIVTEGGTTRQESAYRGLKALHCQDDDIILIHDVARALVNKRIIDDNIVKAKKFGACVTCVSCKNTIIRSINGETISEVTNRDEYYDVQTPQSFTYKLILKAHENAVKKNYANISDDSKLVHLLPYKVALVEGEESNFKITTKEDLELFKSIINS